MITSPRSVQFLGGAPPIADLHRSNHLRTATHISAVSANATSSSSSPSRAAASLYETLGVSLTATNQEIRVAYRRLARTCHPDVGAPADEFMRVHAAYATLSDPGKRADYDREIRVQTRTRPVSPFTSSGGAGGFNRRRTWETDQCW